MGDRNVHIPPVLEAQNVAGAEAHLPLGENVADEEARRNRRLERQMITRGALGLHSRFKVVGGVTLLHNAFLDGKIGNPCL